MKHFRVTGTIRKTTDFLMFISAESIEDLRSIYDDVHEFERRMGHSIIDHEDSIESIDDIYPEDIYEVPEEHLSKQYFHTLEPDEDSDIKP